MASGFRGIFSETQTEQQKFVIEGIDRYRNSVVADRPQSVTGPTKNIASKQPFAS
jgi:hypothetical protein